MLMAERNSWPPGFRFHPTDEELILYYLKRKMCRRRLKLDIIAEIDVYKMEPEELPGLSSLKSADRQWFFFSPRDRKYPNGFRSNRSTRQGYWKTTGKDRIITCNTRNVGVKKTLVFYRGRAPSGERTDWVMHEYTLDEDELRRCQNAQEHYAIYKLFKKSGPGPKNGEQYGALFREEDWVDDDEFPEYARNNDEKNRALDLNGVLATDACRNEETHLSLDDIDEVINSLIAEPDPQPLNVCEEYDFEQALSQFVGEEETPSAVVHALSEEASYPESCITYPLATEQNDLEGSFNVSQVTTGLQSWDVAEVTSTSDMIQQSQHIGDEGFLEMNDLLGPDHIHSHGEVVPTHFSCNFLGNSDLKQGDGCGEIDQFYDADLFLRDLLPGNQAMPYEGDILDPVRSEMNVYPNSINGFGGNMSHCDAYTCMPTTTELNQEPLPLQTTGVVYNRSSVSVSSEPNQNQSGKDDKGAQAWFSSTLWSFVESIPAAPASAAESALVNKAFQRMSSFSRLRINMKGVNATANNSINVSASASAGSRIKGLFFLSFMAAIFAVVCVYWFKYQ